MRKTKGFTLLELLAGLTVASILLAIGIPSFNVAIQNNRMNAKINDMITEINLARSEAVKRGNIVIICPSNDAGTSCNDTTSWTGGWLTYSDINANSSFDADTDIVLRKHSKLKGFKSISSNGGKTQLRFTPDGFAPGMLTTITFCDSRGSANAKGLAIIDTGRVRAALNKDLTCS